MTLLTQSGSMQVQLQSKSACLLPDLPDDFDGVEFELLEPYSPQLTYKCNCSRGATMCIAWWMQNLAGKHVL